MYTLHFKVIRLFWDMWRKVMLIYWSGFKFTENNWTYCHMPTYTLLANHPVALMLHNLTCSWIWDFLEHCLWLKMIQQLIHFLIRLFFFLCLSYSLNDLSNACYINSQLFYQGSLETPGIVALKMYFYSVKLNCKLLNGTKVFTPVFIKSN